MYQISTSNQELVNQSKPFDLSINSTKYQPDPIPFDNLTHLLLQDDLHRRNVNESKYLPFRANATRRLETVDMKQINLSLINASFVSIKDREQVIMSFNKPKKTRNISAYSLNSSVIQSKPP